MLPPVEGRSASAPVSLNINGFQADNPSDVEDPVKRVGWVYKIDTDPAGTLGRSKRSQVRPQP